MTTPPIKFGYTRNYVALPIDTPGPIMEEANEDKSIIEEVNGNAEDAGDAVVGISNALNLAWPANENNTIKLNFDSIKDDLANKEESIFDAHLNAFQLPGTAAKAQDERTSTRDPTIDNQSSQPENEENTPPIDSNSIPLTFSPEMKNILCNIFGEPDIEPDLIESTDIEIPIWLCQQLFNAWKKQPIMENPMDIIAVQDEALGLQDEEIARLLCREMNGFDVGYGKPPIGSFAQENMAQHLTLQLLHEKFDKHFNPNIVDEVYTKSNNNYQYAHDTLQGIIDEQKRGPQWSVSQGPYLKVVKSAAPAAIQPLPRNQDEPILPPPTWSKRLQGEELKDHVHMLRQKAYNHINARNNLYARAQEVYADKKKRAAAYVYSEMARKHHYQAENIQNEVLNNMLHRTQNDKILDLHNLTVEQALNSLKIKLKLIKKDQPQLKELEVITGYGKKQGVAKIKPAIENWLFQKNIICRQLNQGSVMVSMKSVPDNL